MNDTPTRPLNAALDILMADMTEALSLNGSQCCILRGAIVETLQPAIRTEHKERIDAERKLTDQLASTLQGVLDSALHPDIAIRAVMVSLEPVRTALAAYHQARGTTAL